MKKPFISLLILYTLTGCTPTPLPFDNDAKSQNVNSELKETKESSPPSCHSDTLVPLMVCGEYVIVQGKLNRSNNLERMIEGTTQTMYLSSYLNEEENRGLINEEVIISGKCSSELINGSSVLLSLNDTKLLQVTDMDKINNNSLLEACTKLKTINSKKKD
ncbi:MAG: Unknown protein [uncultured Sulfurovum sp.]|uniref:Lipoprotein n=1 Tax=uncultured Sulfurovum sp. TaxID=269237 RepID=A0A6S6TRQ8_9BACT|nr:MAG: Unknown protein [uncultured Sulfurovum sp.]